jgi:hypothetical protein
VTETVIGIETRDAKETATGTVTATKIGTETGTATDGTLVCHSLVVIAFLIADNHSHISSQLEAGVVAVAITGSLKTASDAARYVSLPFHCNVASYTNLILSVDGARARAHRALVLVPLLAHGVVRHRPAAVARAVRDPVAALRVAVHATVIASHQKHSHALLVGLLMHHMKKRSNSPNIASGRTACMSATLATTSSTAT